MNFEEILRNKIATTPSKTAKTILKVVLGEFQQKNSSGKATIEEGYKIVEKIISGNIETLGYLSNLNFVLKTHFFSTVQEIKNQLDKSGCHYTLIQAGVGDSITLGDVQLCCDKTTKNPWVIGFGVTVDQDACCLATKEGVRIANYAHDFSMMLADIITLAGPPDSRVATLKEEIETVKALLPTYLSADEIFAQVISDEQLVSDVKSAKNDGQATGTLVKWCKAQKMEVKGDTVKEVVKKIRS